MCGVLSYISGMKLRSEKTGSLRDVRKQPSTKLAAFVCMCSRSNLYEVEQLANIIFP